MLICHSSSYSWVHSKYRCWRRAIIDSSLILPRAYPPCVERWWCSLVTTPVRGCNFCLPLVWCSGGARIFFNLLCDEVMEVESLLNFVWCRFGVCITSSGIRQTPYFRRAFFQKFFLFVPNRLLYFEKRFMHSLSHVVFSSNSWE